MAFLPQRPAFRKGEMGGGAEAAIAVTVPPKTGSSDVLAMGGGAGGPSGRGLRCCASLVLLLRLLPLLLLPLNQVHSLLMPPLQLLLIGCDVLCFTGGELLCDELRGQSQKAS